MRCNIGFQENIRQAFTPPQSIARIRITVCVWLVGKQQIH